MALYLRKKLDNKAEIAVWQVTESEEELKSLISVPTDELEEISLFRSESQKAFSSFFVCHEILRNSLCFILCKCHNQLFLSYYLITIFCWQQLYQDHTQP